MSAVLQEQNLYPGWDKYNIFDPNQFKPAERTDFIKSIAGEMEEGSRIEDLCVQIKNPKGVQYDLQDLAHQYIVLRNKGARIPKFPRWITGMWANNKEYANELARQGQLAASRKIVLSYDPVDILRSADTKHFVSCFVKTSKSPQADRKVMHEYMQYAQYQYMPAVILEDCPGIGIAYVNDEEGKMMGRQWIHHAKIKETGEDVVVLTNGGYGCLRGSVVSSLLADRGIRTVITLDQYSPRCPKGFREIEFVGCFTKSLHHDLRTWGDKHWAQIVEPVLARK